MLPRLASACPLLCPLLVASGVGLVLPGMSWAQAYPTRSITLIRPFSPGGGADATWRTIIQAASAAIGQQIVLESRPGAAGRNALNALKNATPDGYLLGTGTNIELVIQGLAQSNLVVEPMRDYMPITTTFQNPLVLIANSKVPFRDMKGMIAYAKANPKKLNFGSGGVGSTSHLGVELINMMAGIEIVHVPYKGGAPAQTAVVAGEVELGLAAGVAKPFVDSGKLVAIATTTSSARWETFPNTPTLTELGFPVTVAPWQGLIGPAQLPAEVVAKLQAAFHSALKDPALVAKLRSAGNDIIPSTPAEFAARVQAEYKTWGPVVKKVGLTFN